MLSGSIPLLENNVRSQIPHRLYQGPIQTRKHSFSIFIAPRALFSLIFNWQKMHMIPEGMRVCRSLLSEKSQSYRKISVLSYKQYTGQYADHAKNDKRIRDCKIQPGVENSRIETDCRTNEATQACCFLKEKPIRLHTRSEWYSPLIDYISSYLYNIYTHIIPI
jgi:hypothetical protein